MSQSDHEFEDNISSDEEKDEEEEEVVDEEDEVAEEVADEEDEEDEIADDVEEDEESDEDGEESEKDDSELITNKKIKKVADNAQIGGAEDDDDDEEENNDAYLQKFNADINRQYLTDFHPEAMINNYHEINSLSIVVRDINNNIIDKLHRTLPYLTKYERARVLGQRAKQINSGAKAFVKVPENVIDGYLIAELELAQKRIPFIIRRPIPGGACEYWKLKDLEIIGF